MNFGGYNRNANIRSNRYNFFCINKASAYIKTSEKNNNIDTFNIKMYARKKFITNIIS